MYSTYDMNIILGNLIRTPNEAFKPFEGRYFWMENNPASAGLTAGV